MGTGADQMPSRDAFHPALFCKSMALWKGVVGVDGDSLLPPNYIFTCSIEKRMVMTVKRCDFIKDSRRCEREGRRRE